MAVTSITESQQTLAVTGLRELDKLARVLADLGLADEVGIIKSSELVNGSRGVGRGLDSQAL